jgi:hypothetical protein
MVVITITIMVSLLLNIIEFWIIIHFGKNPKKGGKPPRDSMDISRVNFVLFSIFRENTWGR